MAVFAGGARPCLPDEAVDITALQVHVADVLGLRAQEKVVDVDASGVVAPVKDARVIWYLAVLQHPGQTVYRPADSADHDSRVSTSSPFDQQALPERNASSQPGLRSAVVPTAYSERQKIAVAIDPLNALSHVTSHCHSERE